MFDIGWSELLVLGVIALIFVGPKELPGLLRTIGRYAGVLKRQASEFRSHFDQALKEAELDQLKTDITGFKSEIEGAARDAMRTAEKQAESADRAMRDSEAKPAKLPPHPDPFDGPDITDEDGLTVERPAETAAGKREPSAKPATAVDASKETSGGSEPAPVPEKSGAAQS
jgi:sec-independent protein translocase protein TatB